MNKKKTKNKKKIETLGPLLTILFISVFIVIPLSAVWITSVKDFGDPILKNVLWIVLLPIFIAIFDILINYLFVHFDILNIRSFNFSIPIIILFLTTILFSLINMDLWIKYLIGTIFALISAFITNVITAKIEDHFENKRNSNKPIQNEINN